MSANLSSRNGRGQFLKSKRQLVICSRCAHFRKGRLAPIAGQCAGPSGNGEHGGELVFSFFSCGKFYPRAEAFARAGNLARSEG